MRGKTKKPGRLLAQAWKFLRRLSGDDAYERYLEHHAQTHPDATPLSRKDYFKHEQEWKWDGVRRCC